MGKKKHQNEPNQKSDGESTESCDENQNMARCPHLGKALDMTGVKKAVLKAGYQKDCLECIKNPVMNGSELSEYEVDDSLWMCLKCGNQACGRAKNQHALKHYNTPHSDCHALCVNTTTWYVWCYDCDNDVNVAASKKLLETVEYFRKNSESSKSKSESSMLGINDKVLELVEANVSSSGTCKRPQAISDLARTCGLTNLGNTCFFNSVMQCLGQTPYLLELLEETSVTGQYFQLPGGKLINEDKSSIILEPLDGTLEEWRPLTRFLAETLRTLQSGQAQVHTPRALFSKLTQRMPQFGGGHQHDSHELLRHLLEAVREEDLRRYQAVILDKLGFSKKTDPSSVEGDKKKTIRFYGQQASELLLPTEQVFRGILVSTLQCKDCEHTSHRDEFFLDLSLPITEKQIPPMLRRKADELDDKPSKHQMKKEKRAAKKNKKQKGGYRNMKGSSEDAAQVENKTNDNNSESESDADVEDNVEETKTSVPADVQMKGIESGYNSDKIDSGSPQNNRVASPSMHVDDSGVLSPVIGMLSVSPLDQGSPDNSPSSIEMGGMNLSSPISPNNEMNEDFYRPESRLSFVNNKNTDLKADLEKLSLLNDGDSKKVGVLFKAPQDSEDKQTDEACCNMEEDDGRPDDEEEQEEEEDVETTDMWMGTISARYKCEEGECSVQSCLNQFTACELMTANNKVSCDLCTKRHGGPEKKTVNTNAWKQLLIYNPPAVLILHLKRFQVYHFRPTKINKNVSFPTLLDIAPVCSKRSQNLPTFELGQNKVLYSLYGVVEHSGSMHGGHYVSYVKVRPKLERNSYRWQFLPKNQIECPSEMSRGAQAVPDVPPGKWYYVSDSYVAEVPESKVLKSQAYLLFYERIL